MVGYNPQPPPYVRQWVGAIKPKQLRREFPYRPRV